MDTEFDCPLCRCHFSVDPPAAGQQVKCPICGEAVAVPPATAPIVPQQTPSDMIFCPKCGQRNLENNFKCTRCGFVLHGPAQPQYVVTDDSTMGGLIPYKNARALWSYYLAIFSLMPGIGIPLGVAALIVGIKGLKFSELHPEAKGKVHAWTGIILGSLCAIGYTLLTAVVIMGIAS